VTPRWLARLLAQRNGRREDEARRSSPTGCSQTTAPHRQTDPAPARCR
jgi:hypothetical protein